MEILHLNSVAEMKQIAKRHLNPENLRLMSQCSKIDAIIPQANAAVEVLRTAIYSKMAPFQKWKESCRLRDTAWKLKAAAIRMRHPDWSDSRVRNEVKKIFLYGFT